MKTKISAAFLCFSIALGASVNTVKADSLSALESACRTGVYSACTKYNAAIISLNATQNPTMIYGFDPFAIVPATHAERTPKVPAAAPRDANVGKAGVTAVVTQFPQ